MKDNNKLIIEKDGKKVECEILLSFFCEDNAKMYILYTDHSISEDGKSENEYVASYFVDSKDVVLKNVTDKDELEMVRYAINVSKEG